jgi:hypothetical protein
MRAKRGSPDLKWPVTVGRRLIWENLNTVEDNEGLVTADEVQVGLRIGCV